MNEEQSEKLINVLEEMKELLKPKQDIIYKTEIVKKPDLVYRQLIHFKNKITCDEFYKTLNDEQKQYIRNIRK